MTEAKNPPGGAAEQAGQEADKASGAFPVVGIGASAGGLDAFSRFLKALPDKPGIAFVLVTHLAPEHKSILAEILARSTKMPVKQAEDKMEVEANHVYVIPPNTNIALFHGHLSLRERQPGLNMPVDQFFHSLAQEQRDRAIGVVLSGTGSDGVRGLKEIKTENGLTFAQDPETAEYSGMPRAAVTSGSVDFILPPEQIAERVVKISRHPFLRRKMADSREPLAIEGQEDQLTKIFVLLRSQTGADFSLYKRSTLQRRIARRMVIKKMEDMADYVKLLEEDPREVDRLFQDVLIHVTSFFREADVFDVLQSKVFPAIYRQKSPGDTVRVWVPGCSTGEEAYSVAIALAEFNRKADIHPAIQIFATDLNDKMIEQARQGYYPEDVMGEVSEERLVNYFTSHEHGYRVNHFIREMCIFAKHDIIRDPPFSHMDLISFRNVLIYMERALQMKIIPTLNYALELWGYLLLGKSEHIGEFSELFRTFDKKFKIFAKNPSARNAQLNVTMPLNRASLDDYISSTAEPRAGKARHEFDPQKEANRIALARLAPPGVLINDEMQVLQFRGDTGRYLMPSPGRATFDLLTMAREGLGLELRTAIDEARKKNETVTRRDIKIKLYDELIDIDLSVIHFHGPDEESFFLVTFSETGRQRVEEAAAGQKKDAGTIKNEEIEVARRELESTKLYLQSMIEEKEEVNEELRAANEEVQSSNEELLSINEELETAKEELQSANEELTTLNEELQKRNVELGTINDDLINVLNSVGVPMIIVTSDLKVRRITAAAEKTLEVSAADINRPIGDLNLFSDSLDLKRLTSEVVESITPVAREASDINGRRFNVEIRPYKTSDNRINGAVLTAVDVTDLRRSLEVSNIFLETANTLTRTFNVEKLLASLLDIIHTAIPACRIVIFRLDPENEELEVMARTDGTDRVGEIMRFDDASPVHREIIEEKKVLSVDFSDEEAAEVDTPPISKCQSAVFIPMISRGRIIGDMSIDFPGEMHDFKAEEISLLEGIATQAAVAVENAMLFGAKDHIASVLQEALFSRPHDFEGIDFDYIYQSATEAAGVGGDFYDIFEITPDRLGIVIGDVAGKGIEAASYASETRDTIKAYALEHDRPDQVLAMANKVLTNGSKMDFVTVFFGVLDLKANQLVYCNGGHPPGLMANGNKVEALDAVSTVLGAFEDGSYSSNNVSMSKEDCLVLYTDGVIETRRDDELFGMDRLIESISEARNPEKLTRRVYDRILDFGRGQLQDDIAILVVCRRT